MTNQHIAFLIGRITLGVNFAAHGIVRLPKITKFSEGMVKGFQGTLIGIDAFISAFAHTLVFLELALGIALLVGFQIKKALVVMSVIFMILIFGASMKEDWGLVGSQMIYVIFGNMMLKDFVETKYSLDALLKK